MNVLVVPSNRPDHLRTFLDAWQPWPWDHVVIVEDAPSPSTREDDARITRLCWSDIDRDISVAGVISRGDSAIRAFGFWHAWKIGAEVILTLDDDCYPSDDGWVARHRSNLFETPKWQSSWPGLRVRGLPYENGGTMTNVAVSVGLWRGHPDLDAIQTLASRPIEDRILRHGVRARVMSSDQLFPMSGMNLACRRDAACLMYFPPMGHGSPFARFDDIWAGLVIQRICRHLRLAIVCGGPLIDHQRASDPFANLVKEAPGIRAHEELWTAIDRVPLTAATSLAAMRQMGCALERETGFDGYLRKWGQGIRHWCQLF